MWNICSEDLHDGQECLWHVQLALLSFGCMAHSSSNFLLLSSHTYLFNLILTDLNSEGKEEKKEGRKEGEKKEEEKEKRKSCFREVS